MPYLLLVIGLTLAALAAWRLAPPTKERFDDALRAEVTRPINRELVALYELQESVEAALVELEEKNQVFNHLLGRLEKQRETVDFRLQQMERLVSRTEAVLNNPAGRLQHNGQLRYQHDQVYQLSDQGKNVTEVALELGMGKGEVELILGLRK